MLTAATKPPLRPAPQSPENISTSVLVGEKCRETSAFPKLCQEELHEGLFEKSEASLRTHVDAMYKGLSAYCNLMYITT
ncbi:hypothetical protein AgCh_032963 [Apium graveolens]